jgi:hypothetical protein
MRIAGELEGENRVDVTSLMERASKVSLSSVTVADMRIQNTW